MVLFQIDYGEVFDIDNATRVAIEKMIQEENPVHYCSKMKI
jgi:hypothetical protein